MIKLQDFARDCGVTDRAIQKHLKTYAAELEGLFERRGPNGTWLSDEACEILRSKMKQQPIVVGDSDIYRKYDELREKNEHLLEALNAAKDRIIDLQDAQAKLDAAERETKLLEGFIQDAKAEIGILTDENADLRAESRKKDEILKQTKESLKNASDELIEARAEIERMKRAGLWQRIRGWKKRTYTHAEVVQMFEDGEEKQR